MIKRTHKKRITFNLPKNFFGAPSFIRVVSKNPIILDVESMDEETANGFIKHARENTQEFHQADGRHWSLRSGGKTEIYEKNLTNFLDETVSCRIGKEFALVPYWPHEEAVLLFVVPERQ